MGDLGEALSDEILIGLGVRLVNPGVILVELILGMDWIILHLMVISSLFTESDSYVEELRSWRPLTTQEAMLVRRGVKRWPKRRKAEGGARRKRDLWPT